MIHLAVLVLHVLCTFLADCFKVISYFKFPVQFPRQQHEKQIGIFILYNSEDMLKNASYIDAVITLFTIDRIRNMFSISPGLIIELSLHSQFIFMGEVDS